MSELQIAVAVVGVLLIVLVVGYNVFQEWRYRRKTRDVFSQDQKTDVLVDSPFILATGCEVRHCHTRVIPGL